MSTEKEVTLVSNADSKVLQFLQADLIQNGGKYYTPPFQIPNDKFDVHTNFTGTYKVMRCVEKGGIYTYITSGGSAVVVTCSGHNEQPFYDVKDGLWIQLELSTISDVQILL